MIAHALTIIRNEVRRHFSEVYGLTDAAALVTLGNITQGFSTGAITREILVLSVVNLREERSLRNLPSDDAPHTVVLQKPMALTVTLLVSATHAAYGDGLLALSRVLRMFHSQPLYTNASVASESMSVDAPDHAADRLASFKMAVEFHSPTLEEQHDLWSTLGAKHFPSAVYQLRMLDLAFESDS